jgi:hypothetical protein
VVFVFLFDKLRVMKKREVVSLHAVPISFFFFFALVVVVVAEEELWKFSNYF